MASYSTQTLAQGCFGKIYKQKYEDTWAAIKKVPRHLINEKDLQRECAVYKKSNHPNIVKLLGPVTLRDGKWIIPLEFIFGEDLETTIFKASKSKIQLTPAIKGTIIIGMCEGLLHLHSKDIVHQDLKPDNIMVEHKTNRAVIIDMGLAKFFRCGLSSAADMGNEAYSAPEVLQRGSQRNQQSDVWAMGKIIAELCARIRLHTPSVCPAKIKEILKDQPYCHAVCRMTEPNPSLRASMGGAMSELRKAAKSSAEKDFLKPPSAHINVRDKSPSPANRDPSPVNRTPSPFNRDPTPINRDPSPMRRDPSPMRRTPSPFNRDPTPINRDPSPMRRAASPFNRDPSPMRRSPSPFNRDPTPINRDQSPMRRSPSPFNRDPTPINRAPSPFNRDPSPLDRISPPKKWEHSPKPDLNAHKIPSPQRTDDKTKNTALVPVGGAELNQDFLKMQLYQEASKGLPCNLPTTGRVVVRRFEQKNGEVETWAQKEVVTRDGKIIKFDDITFNSN